MNDKNLFKTLAELFFLSTPLLVSLIITITTIIFSTSIILTVFADYANQQTESNYDLLEVPADSFDSFSIHNFLSFKDLYSKNQYPNVNIQIIECRNSNFNLNGITNEVHQNSKVANDEQGPTTNPSKGIERFIDKSFNIDKNEIELCFNANLNGQITKSIEDSISATLYPVVPNDAKSDDLTVKMANELPSERNKINSDYIYSNGNLSYADGVDSIMTFQSDADKGDRSDRASSENEVDTGSEEVDTGSEEVDTGSEEVDTGGPDTVEDSPNDDVIEYIKTIFDKDEDEPKNHFHTKKIIKYKNSKCLTQSSSIPLLGQIGPRTPVLIADFYPCKVQDGRASLILPNDVNLVFVVMHIERDGDENDGIMVAIDKIQSLNKNNAFFTVNFDDKMGGIDPITGEEKTIDDINAIALFNTSTETIEINSGNSLAISAILKS